MKDILKVIWAFIVASWLQVLAAVVFALTYSRLRYFRNNRYIRVVSMVLFLWPFAKMLYLALFPKGLKPGSGIPTGILPSPPRRDTFMTPIITNSGTPYPVITPSIEVPSNVGTYSNTVASRNPIISVIGNVGIGTILRPPDTSARDKALGFA